MNALYFRVSYMLMRGIFELRALIHHARTPPAPTYQDPPLTVATVVGLDSDSCMLLLTSNLAERRRDDDHIEGAVPLSARMLAYRLPPSLSGLFELYPAALLSPPVAAGELLTQV